MNTVTVIPGLHPPCVAAASRGDEFTYNRSYDIVSRDGL